MATDKEMIANNGEAEAQAYPMQGGDGTYSYSNNSSYQGEVRNAAKELVNQAIVENLDMLKSSSSTTILRVADLGCSVGPNTFSAVQDIVEAIELKCQNLKSQIPEFQVFFNDHSSNDFNTLFLSLPPERRYHAAGVPGSFYTRLFPGHSLHVVHISYSIHWLSRVPKEVLDRSSPAWNKGMIYYSSASDEVIEAYSAQSAEDLGRFLQVRAEEIADGGLIILIFLGRPDGTPHSQVGANIAYDLLGSCLFEMAKKGIVKEEEVDMFNLPMYYMSPKEVEEGIERNGCFSLEKMERIQSQTIPTLTPKAASLLTRSIMEGPIKAHFGEEILDQLFDLYTAKLENEVSMRDLAERTVNVCAVLKRKAI